MADVILEFLVAAYRLGDAPFLVIERVGVVISHAGHDNHRGQFTAARSIILPAGRCQHCERTAHHQE